MKYCIKDSVMISFRSSTTRLCLLGVQTIVFALCIFGILLTTSVSAADLVSVNSAGTDSGNESSFNPAISANGRFVAFASAASDLVATDTNGEIDVFVRDLQSGATTLVSINSAGTDSGNGGSGGAVISADGRFVAFYSTASDLVATDTNGEIDVFVRDLQTGTTTLVSVNRSGTDSGNESSEFPVISADGRFVAFESVASDLVARDTNPMSPFPQVDVFVRDLQTGTTTLVSVNRSGTDSGSGESYLPEISADGRFVAFRSSAFDLVATDTNGMVDVFVFGAPNVSFEPDPSTYTFTPDPAGCQTGAVGKFSFDATLTNISEKTLSNIRVEVNELTNNNLLLTNNGLIGEGGRFEVPKIDDYADGELAPKEWVDVPFIVCLQNKDPFRLFVNVLTQASHP